MGGREHELARPRHRDSRKSLPARANPRCVYASGVARPPPAFISPDTSAAKDRVCKATGTEDGCASQHLQG